MTLQEFLDKCRTYESSRDPVAGLAYCDELLHTETVQGRLLAAALRYKAAFLLMCNQGWALTAIGHLKAVLETGSTYPFEAASALSTLVGAYATHGVYGSARKYADQYLAMAEANSEFEIRQYLPKVWFNLAYAYEAGGQFPLAVDAYKQSYEAALSMPEVFSPGRPAHNLVQVYLELGRVEDAMVWLQESKNHLDEAAVGSFMKNQEAWCLHAAGRYAEAEAACREALVHPSCNARVRAEVLFTQARVHLAEGRTQDAAQLASEAHNIAVHMPHPRLSHKVERFLLTLNAREEVPES